MTDRTITNPDVEAYCAAHTSVEPPYLAAVDADTRASFGSLSVMLTGRMEGRFLTLLAAMVGARRILEIGTFTGYSALSMAAGMPEGGRLVSCEIEPGHAAVARANIAASPHADRIEIHEGPALQTLRALPGPFDLVFIDADKVSYPAYYDQAVRLLAPHGVIALDNSLRGGDVLDPGARDPGTRAIAALNDRIAADPSVDAVLLPIRDGVMLVRAKT